MYCALFNSETECFSNEDITMLPIIVSHVSVNICYSIDPNLSFRAVEALLDNERLTRVHFAGLNAELGLPLLVEKCSKAFGMRLWLLTDPTVSWADLAVALYSIHSDETDIVLRQLKQKYLPNTG